jgi:hypothetical protein
MDISFAPTSPLGTPSSPAYRASFGIWLYGLFGVLLLLAGSAGIVDMFVSGIFLGIQLVVSLGAFAIAGLFAYLCYSGVTSQVQIYEHGFAYTQRNSTYNFRWDEIDAIWQHIVTYRIRLLIFFIPVSSSYKYTIRKTDGETIKLTNSIRKVGELGTRIQQQVLKHKMPGAIEAYNSGDTLQFGKLSISQTGINNGKETIPWEQVNGVQIVSGYITIKKTGKWLRWAGVDASQVPNIFLFVALVDRIVGVNADRA